MLKFLPPALAIFCVIHFFRIGEHWKAREWYYDAFTKDVMVMFWKNIPDSEKISLGLDWIYHPSADYYYTTRKMNFLKEPLVYSKTLPAEKAFDYYYVDPGQTDPLKASYSPLLFLKYQGILFKRKSYPYISDHLKPYSLGDTKAVPSSWTEFD